MMIRGVCELALKLRSTWEGLHLKNGMQSRGQNRTREIRLSGIVGGLWETWSMVELGTRRTIERVRVGHSPPTDARAQFLSRQPHAAFDVAGAGNGLTDWLVRHSQRKRGETDRPVLRRTAPDLDPTRAEPHAPKEPSGQDVLPGLLLGERRCEVFEAPKARDL